MFPHPRLQLITIVIPGVKAICTLALKACVHDSACAFSSNVLIFSGIIFHIWWSGTDKGLEVIRVIILKIWTISLKHKSSLTRTLPSNALTTTTECGMHYECPKNRCVKSFQIVSLKIVYENFWKGLQVEWWHLWLPLLHVWARSERNVCRNSFQYENSTRKRDTLALWLKHVQTILL